MCNVFFEQVVHEDSQPSEIVFTVQSPPALGSLLRFPPNDKHHNNNGEQQHLYQVQSSLRKHLKQILLHLKPNKLLGSNLTKPDPPKSDVSECLTSY